MRLDANPNYYDYIHAISLGEDGICELMDGGGQCMSFMGNGEYTITKDTLSITDFQQTQWMTNKLIGEKVSWDVKFKIENGRFLYGSMPYSKKCIYYYTQRYVFEYDPISLCQNSRDNNLMFLLEKDKDSDDNRRIFYCSDRGTIDYDDYKKEDGDVWVTEIPK